MKATYAFFAEKVADDVLSRARKLGMQGTDSYLKISYRITKLMDQVRGYCSPRDGECELKPLDEALYQSLDDIMFPFEGELDRKELQPFEKALS